ncbi:MAG: Stp1/IreP family PP2C-type Ser/Thr phosphatase [Comamonadaceae bacterium]|nr:MAG: Stp1/IreP family PP2C-type Ser/Thr phosphatase [Comamonadaceae bacterium]
MESSGALTRPPGVGLKWQYAALTDVGRMRANNEDAVEFDAALGLAILADGMGGYNGGEVASGMAVALLRASFGRWIAHSGPAAPVRAMYRALQASVDEANDAIYEAGIANPKLQGMGTTLVLAAFGADRAVIGHIGDSRCYRLRDHRLELLTRDHSLLQEQLDAGAITAEAAARSPHRNLVTRALGIEPKVLLEMHAHDALAGDLYLLCSDGLSELVSDAQLFTILVNEADLPQKATQLVATANENGGRDNISVVLAKASGVDLPS